MDVSARRAWAAVASKMTGSGKSRPVARRGAVQRPAAPKSGVVAPVRSKYGAVKVDGYASKREAKRAAELKLLQKAGQIRGLREQVRFDLIPAQYENGKCVEHACSYVADFVYVGVVPVREDGLRLLPREVVEDAKGVRTPDYIIKRKLMLFLKKIRITEV